MIEICALASGSNGNCYYIGSKEEAIIIDAGISRRKIIERMKIRGLDPQKIKAGFITHEHLDHYRGAKVLGQKLGIPFYISSQTLNRSHYTMRPQNVITFNPGDIINIGGLTIHSFLKHHDAAEPCSFRVQAGTNNIGVFTDIGEPCENVKDHLSKCDFLFLESNYDIDMLEAGKYPAYLKKRVAGKFGHLSNCQAKQLVEDNAGDNLKTIYLSHISEDNNRGDIALETFTSLMNKYKIKLTSRYAASEVEQLET